MRRFKEDLRVGQKFLLVGAFILPFLLVLSSAGIWGAITIDSLLDEVQGKQLAAILDTSLVLTKVQSARGHLREALLDNDSGRIDEALTTAQTDIVSSDLALKRYTNAAHSSEEELLENQAQGQWQDWKDKAAQLEQLARFNTPASDQQGLDLIRSHADQPLLDTLTTIVDFNRKAAEDAQITASNTFTTVIILITGFTLIVIVAFVVLMGFLSRTLTVPISRLQKTSSQLANGVLHVRLEVGNLAAKDELTQLMLAFNSMANRLEDNAQTSERVSTSVLALTSELNAAAEQQASTNQENLATVSQVTSSLEELNETANQIANATSQVAEVADLAAVVVKEVAQSSAIAKTNATEGTKAVEQVLLNVSDTRNQIELMGQQLVNLAEQTRQIGNVIELIDSLADETHLLALNASIEAAGSDDYGSGGTQLASVRGARFGVIAQEVKNLAGRSRQATEDVYESLTLIQGAVAATVLIAEETKKQTVQALARSEIAGSVITRLSAAVDDSANWAEQIVENVGSVQHLTEEIRLATGQQRSANQQILTTMHNIAQITRDSTMAVTQLSEAASAVNRQMFELNRLISRPALVG